METQPAATQPAGPAATQPAGSAASLPARPGWLYRAFNLSILSKSRLAWVDYLRGIAIVLVVYRHVLIGIQRSVAATLASGQSVPKVPDYLETANMIFFSFRMPLFFILSGIFISGSLARKSLKQLIGIKFENLLYPYLIWVFLQVTFQILLGANTNSNRTLIAYTYIFYQPRDLDQFWYLPALFNTTVIYLLVKTYLK
ncbi:MAG TPA: acyltransferase, partial [Puia sp.]|nr:acyltransferase [Puia sp.]